MKTTLLSILAVGLLGAPVAGFCDIITLQIPGIPGDAKFAANNGLPPDSIRVLTVGSGVENVISQVGGGGGTGKPVFSDVSVVKKFGESSPALFMQIALGRFLPEAWIRFYRMKQGVPVKYFEIRLTEVLILSQKWVGNSNSVDAPDAENLALQYARIEMLDVESGARACYNLRSLTQC